MEFYVTATVPVAVDIRFIHNDYVKFGCIRHTVNFLQEFI